MGTQTEFGFAMQTRITRRQYAYATMRGRMPAAFSDWQCKLLADGMSEEEVRKQPRSERNKAGTTAIAWNAIPAVQDQIEYERARAMEARVEAPLRAWEAKMAKMYGMAAGELPMIRTVAVTDKEDGRQLIEESYFETNLTAMAKTLEMEGRALAIFKDKTELSGPDGTAAIQVTFVRPGDPTDTEESGDHLLMDG